VLGRSATGGGGNDPCFVYLDTETAQTYSEAHTYTDKIEWRSDIKHMDIFFCVTFYQRLSGC